MRQKTTEEAPGSRAGGRGPQQWLIQYQAQPDDSVAPHGRLLYSRHWRLWRPDAGQQQRRSQEGNAVNVSGSVAGANPRIDAWPDIDRAFDATACW
ncbi:MAG TPA: hypothetical protein VF177_10440 [Anaerolineae bacterium]